MFYVKFVCLNDTSAKDVGEGWCAVKPVTPATQ